LQRAGQVMLILDDQQAHGGGGQARPRETARAPRGRRFTSDP